ncbi:hypothetical protein G3I28_22915, partial [Streptomyces sp. SID10116]|nr:hypothetical protein [Streptomyces sp. SID10116]
MRALPVRRLATTTLCAALLLGTAGPALASVGDAPHDPARTVTSAPAAPDPMAQVQQLSTIGKVLTPVTELLTAVLKAPGNKLSADEAKKHADAVKAALDAAAKPPAKGATKTADETAAKTTDEAAAKTVEKVAPQVA